MRLASPERRWAATIAWIVAGACSTVAAPAHDLRISAAVLTVGADGGLVLDFTCDLDALALGVPSTADDHELAARMAALPPEALEATLERLREQLLRRVKVRLDGDVAPMTVSFPQRHTPRPADEPPSFLGLIARFAGRQPPTARAVTVMASRAFPPVHLTIHDQRHGGIETLEILEQGARSTPYDLTAPPPAPDRLQVARRYLGLGFAHILPRGLDHVLFVLGLFFFAARFRPLLVQVTAFTAAHTVTLALATLGVVRLPPAIVEPLIALSIVWIAVENVLARRAGAGAEAAPRAALVRRTAAVFGFGLLHGLGFAGVLAELGLPRAALATALLAFNVGVEAGQIAVLALAFLAVGWARHQRWFGPRIALPASLAIAAVGLYWLIERVI